jgi:predicted short-subunit dehydrogenase-like oxidoreductase (DUF2520 family)
VPSVRIVGPGRAGGSLAGALQRVGWVVAQTLGRGDDLTEAAEGVDAVVIATPDVAIAGVAAAIAPRPPVAFLHLSGAAGLDQLAPHRRRASLHPLMTLPDPDTGTRRLGAGITFAVSGDPMAAEMVSALGGRAVHVPTEARALYHAAAAAASNHVVATLGQVGRLAALVGLTLDDFLPLARAATDDAGRLGAAAALTGPVARGDWRTVAEHLAALPADEHAGYLGGVSLALRLATGR